MTSISLEHRGRPMVTTPKDATFPIGVRRQSPHPGKVPQEDFPITLPKKKSIIIIHPKKPQTTTPEKQS